MPIVCNLIIIKRSKLTIKCNCSPAALGPKPGPRQIAPKKNSLVKQRKMTKVRLVPPFSVPSCPVSTHTERLWLTGCLV